MSHIYTSLAFALQNNKDLLEASSDKFKLLILQIQSKQFSGSQTDIAKQVNYALKAAAKLVNNNKHMYIINGTMQEELDFIQQALQEDSGIDFETPVAFIIPRIPTALLFGDSSLQSCGGYSFELKIWWYVQFPHHATDTSTPQKQRRQYLHLHQLLGIYHNYYKLLCCADIIL
jgi:hypothetical protein